MCTELAWKLGLWSLEISEPQNPGIEANAKIFQKVFAWSWKHWAFALIDSMEQWGQETQSPGPTLGRECTRSPCLKVGLHVPHPRCEVQKCQEEILPVLTLCWWREKKKSLRILITIWPLHRITISICAHKCVKTLKQVIWFKWFRVVGAQESCQEATKSSLESLQVRPQTSPTGRVPKRR